MPASTIIVSHRDGSAASSARVVLGFSSGQSSPSYTDRRGHATVEHSSVGTAAIYVNGDKVGTFHAPGRTAVVVR